MKKLIIMMTILIMAAWSCPAAAYDVEGVNIHGFVSQGYLYSDEYNYLATDTKDGSFEYNEAGINFSKQLTDKLRVGLQLFSRDLGDVANNKITLDWAYGDYRFKDWLGLRAGKIKLPLGLYNETRDMDMLRTSIVLPQGIYSDLLRDNSIAMNGVGLYGNVDMKVAGSLEYQLLAGGMNFDTEGGLGKYTANSLQASSGISGTVIRDYKSDTAYIGALRWETPLEGLKLGYSVWNESALEIPIDIPVNIGGGVMGTMSITSEASAFVQIFSVEYAWKDLIVAAEYMRQDSESTTLGNESSLTAESYYLSASYKFTDLFTLGAYYSEFYPDMGDKDGENLVLRRQALGQIAVDHMAWQKDLALTLRFDINDYMVFKIEGHSVNGTADVLMVDNNNTTNNSYSDFSDSQWYYGAAKLSVSF